MAKNVFEVVSLLTHKETSSLKVQIPKGRNCVAVEEVEMVQKDHVVSVRFPAKRRDVGKCLFDALLKGELDVSQGDIR